MNYSTLKDIKDVSGVPVLVRLDLNVPVQDGRVVDDYRIRKAMPTISYLRERKAKVIIVSHIEGGTDTLKSVYEYLKKDMPVSFCEDCLESGKGAVDALLPGDVLLCENLRLYDGEKKNDESFAQKLASLARLFVNDAFSVSHRKHASIVGVPKFLPSYAGLQFEEEIKNLSICFNPKHPFVFLLGGAKFDTKLPLVDAFLSTADTIIVAGALSNDIFKARGLEIGGSLVSETGVDFSSYISNPKIVTPTDVVVETAQGERAAKKVTDISHEDKIWDLGPESLEQFKNIVSNARTILWNGPFGYYEHGFIEPTREMARTIVGTQAATIVGGGDTLAAISELGLEESFTFVSTGGGAMLDFLANKTLPGLEALAESAKPEGAA